MRVGWVAVLVLSAAGGGACSQGDPVSAPLVVRDSAGVSIVENFRPASDRTEPSPVAEDVLLQIGSVLGDADTELSSVTAVRFFGADRLVVAHAGHELRVYDGAGSLVRQFGADGEGPGEFRRISGVSITTQGHLSVVDGRLLRLTEFDYVGTTLRTRSLEGPLPRQPRLVDDTWIVGQSVGRGLVLGDQIERPADTVVAIRIRDGTRHVWAVTPGRLLKWVRDPGGLIVPLQKEMTPTAQVMAHQGGVAFGSPDRYEIRLLDRRGQLRRIIRRVVPAAPMTDAIEEPYWDRWERAGAAEFLRPQFVDSVPRFNELMVDRGDRIWVRLEEGGYRPDRYWDLFEPGGVWLGTVELPDDFTPHDLCGDRIAGVWRDELGVEFVQVRRVVLPAPLPSLDPC